MHISSEVIAAEHSIPMNNEFSQQFQNGPVYFSKCERNEIVDDCLAVVYHHFGVVL